MKDPVRDLPKAIIISVFLVTVFYALANIAFYTTLNVSEVLGSEAVAVVRKALPNIWLFPFVRLLPDACMGRLHFWYLSLWHFPLSEEWMGFYSPRQGNKYQESDNEKKLMILRLIYSGACEGQMPEILSMIQVGQWINIYELKTFPSQIKRMTPAPSVLSVVSNSWSGFCTIHLPPLKAILSCCYLFSSSIFALMNYVGFATWVGSDYPSSNIYSQLSIGLAVFCLPYLRWKHPEWERPIKVRFVLIPLFNQSFARSTLYFQPSTSSAQFSSLLCQWWLRPKKQVRRTVKTTHKSMTLYPQALGVP